MLPGQGVAGVVVRVGVNVTRFHEGQRVIAYVATDHLPSDLRS